MPIPRDALALGLLGLVPFYGSALAAFAATPVHTIAVVSFAIYAATILSFLGGVRWGLALTQSPPPASAFALSVIPSIVGWVTAAAMALEPARVGAATVFAIAFLGQFLWDRSATSAGAPAWYPRLRLILTVGVLGACLTLAAATVYHTA